MATLSHSHRTPLRPAASTPLCSSSRSLVPGRVTPCCTAALVAGSAPSHRYRVNTDAGCLRNYASSSTSRAPGSLSFSHGSAPGRGLGTSRDSRSRRALSALPTEILSVSGAFSAVRAAMLSVEPMLAHVEAYTVILLGILQAVYLVRSRPLSPFKDGSWGTPRSQAGQGFVPDAVLLGFRTLAFAYCFVFLLCHNHAIGWWTMRYYTQWNWLLLTVYFFFSALESWRLQLSKAKGGKAENDKVDWIGHTAVVLYHVCTTMVMLIDFVTWVALVPMLTTHNPDPARAAVFVKVFYSFWSYNTHIFNAVLMLADGAMNRMPFFTHCLGYVGLWSSLFGVWANVWHAATGKWLYPFLDTSQPWAWKAYAALFVAHWIFYAVFYGFHTAKGAIFRPDGREPVREKLVLGKAQ